MKSILLKTITALAAFFPIFYSNAQITGQWAWMSGANTFGSGGTYGTLGTAAAANAPANRDGHSTWKDASGNFWLFGGENQALNDFNDLWEYNPGTGWWTWISGSSSTNATAFYGTKGDSAAANHPGARYGTAGWTDPSGNIWIFGGVDKTSTYYYNDLWEYSNNEWTWISGSNIPNATAVYGTKGTPGNAPGARFYASGWADDSGNVWIFGGRDQNKNVYNDLWKYSPLHKQWIWEGGSSTPNGGGSYGTEGTGTATTTPPARFGQIMRTDASGNAWLFGGADNNENYFNDAWEYSGGQWAWVGGSSATNVNGVYGIEGVPAAGNMPGGRIGAAGTTDPFGNFWIFGGNGYDANGNYYMLNDLWMFSPTTGQWAWINGANTINQAATYGTKGTAAAANTPNAREYAGAWADNSGNIWVMGGFDQNGNDYNDLWEFSLKTPLPLTIVDLQGSARCNYNLLAWQTEGEINTTSFVVERSTDGTNFLDIGSVGAVGSGNNQYSFKDIDPPPSQNTFYRLKIEQTGGMTSYSSTIVLSNTAAGSVSVYPNPAISSITLRIGTQALLNTPVKLFDLSGRLIAEQSISGTQQTMDLHRLPAGLYLLQFANGAAVKITKE